MTKKSKGRKINSKCVRSMLTFSFCKFKTFLKSKAETYKDTRVFLESEEYTSKTCTNCGVIAEKLKGNKVFSCQNCKLCIDRDLNGSRNILLKFLSKYASL